MVAENRLGSAAHTAKLQEVQPGRQAILFQGYPPCETLARSWMWKRLAQVQDLRRGGCSHVSSPAVHGDPGPIQPLIPSMNSAERLHQTRHSPCVEKVADSDGLDRRTWRETFLRFLRRPVLGPEDIDFATFRPPFIDCSPHGPMSASDLFSKALQDACGRY